MRHACCAICIIYAGFVSNVRARQAAGWLLMAAERSVYARVSKGGKIMHTEKCNANLLLPLLHALGGVNERQHKSFSSLVKSLFTTISLPPLLSLHASGWIVKIKLRKILHFDLTLIFWFALCKFNSSAVKKYAKNNDKFYPGIMKKMMAHF